MTLGRDTLSDVVLTDSSLSEAEYLSISRIQLTISLKGNVISVEDGGESDGEYKSSLLGNILTKGD